MIDTETGHCAACSCRLRSGVPPILLFLFVLSVAASCGGEADGRLELPATPVISARESWVVVRSAYVQLMQEPAADAAIRGHVRRGAILAIDDRTPYLDTVDGQSDHWLAVRDDELFGWVFAAYVDGYSTRAQAETAAALLRGE
ncbi:MAG: hypothetical protein EA384_01505 [Spirochaetaceae bacterium]|nr:MAG: hypothetical protein EA384_01505 [Spirochaetaceae bacterium]